MLNYTKAGKPFWNLLTVAPIRDGLGVLRFIVGIQVGAGVSSWRGVRKLRGCSAGCRVAVHVCLV